MAVDMTPPPAVIEFAEKSGYKDVTPNAFWVGTTPGNNFKDYKVFDVNDKDVYFCFILVKKDEIRYATEEEAKQLSDVFF